MSSASSSSSSHAAHHQSKGESEHRPSLQINVPKYSPRAISGADFLSFVGSSAPSSSSSSKSSQLIVDVRDSDSSGGQIVGSKNIPHSRFEAEVDSLVKELSASHSGPSSRLIFLCQYGQERSPAASASFLSHWQSLLEEGKEPPEVCFVRGGFTEIINEAVQFSSTGAVTLTGTYAPLFEGFDPHAWVGVKDPAQVKPFVAIYKKDVDSAYVLLKK